MRGLGTKREVVEAGLRLLVRIKHQQRIRRLRGTLLLLAATACCYCLLHHLPLLHADRDFDALEEHLGLVIWRGRAAPSDRT